MDKKTQSPIPDEVVINKIYFLRNKKVMIDRDLAELFGVETKRLKEAVRRNIQRFPEDFMFEMNDNEFAFWRTQFATSKSDQKGLRYKPYCFTESGVTMLSCVLSSERAILVNIQILRLFIRLRELVSIDQDILLQLENLYYAVEQNSDDIQSIFAALKELLNQPKQPILGRIGFIKE